MTEEKKQLWFVMAMVLIISSVITVAANWIPVK
jgi:hypothetical protein